MAYTIVTVRLTEDNVETIFRPGDVFTDDPEFGVVTNAWALSGGRAKIFTDRDADTFGIPQTVRLTRVTV